MIHVILRQPAETKGHEVGEAIDEEVLPFVPNHSEHFFKNVKTYKQRICKNIQARFGSQTKTNLIPNDELREKINWEIGQDESLVLFKFF